jgi:uncharacterized damage-inducible protein DinB
MISPAAFKELFDHNYWARDRQLQACAALTQEQFVRPMGGSFPSLRDTLAHLVAVEWIWLERWRGRPPRSLLPAEEFPTLAAVSERWRAVEREMREYLAGLSEEALERPATCVDTRGRTWTYPLWRMIFHLLNHQSYHRGQIATLLRQLGAQAVGVDFLIAHDMGFREVRKAPAGSTT